MHWFKNWKSGSNRGLWSLLLSKNARPPRSSASDFNHDKYSTNQQHLAINQKPLFVVILTCQNWKIITILSLFNYHFITLHPQIRNFYEFFMIRIDNFNKIWQYFLNVFILPKLITFGRNNSLCVFAGFQRWR